MLKIALIILFTNSGGSGGVAIDSSLSFTSMQACELAASQLNSTRRQVGWVAAYCVTTNAGL